MQRKSLLLCWVLLAGCAAQAPIESAPSTDAPPPAATAAVAAATRSPAPPIVDQSAWLRDFRTRYGALRASARGEDMAALLRDAEAALALAPDVPMVQYLYAAALVANARRNEAFAALSRLADTGISFGVGESPAFAALKDDPRFAPLVARFAGNREPRGVVELAFNAAGLPADFVPESILRDHANARWLLGSVRHRRIDAVDDRGGAYDVVAGGAGGLLSVLGMRQIGDTLWVASAGFAETAGLAATDVGRSGLFEIDAGSGQVRRSWWLPSDGAAHALGDVLLLGSDVYASDSIGGGIHRLAATRDALTTVVAPGLLLSPQGMAALDDRRIAVADYPSGLWLLDRDSGALQRLLPAGPEALTGIDGLYVHRGALIAIQNGTNPKRILRISLSDAGSEITSVEVLAQNLLGWGEPSLATVHDGALYYIANSQWDRFGPKGTLPPLDQLETPRVMRLGLD
jgi:hypothetical protein